MISTTHVALHVVLQDGTYIATELDSRGQIYCDHVTTEQVLAQVNTSNRYAARAGRIRIDSITSRLALYSRDESSSEIGRREARASSALPLFPCWLGIPTWH